MNHLHLYLSRSAKPEAIRNTLYPVFLPPSCTRLHPGVEAREGHIPHLWSLLPRCSIQAGHLCLDCGKGSSGHSCSLLSLQKKTRMAGKTKNLPLCVHLDRCQSPVRTSQVEGEGQTQGCFDTNITTDVQDLDPLPALQTISRHWRLHPGAFSHVFSTKSNNMQAGEKEERGGGEEGRRRRKEEGGRGGGEKERRGEHQLALVEARVEINRRG